MTTLFTVGTVFKIALAFLTGGVILGATLACKAHKFIRKH